MELRGYSSQASELEPPKHGDSVAECGARHAVVVVPACNECVLGIIADEAAPIFVCDAFVVCVEAANDGEKLPLNETINLFSIVSKSNGLSGSAIVVSESKFSYKSQAYDFEIKLAPSANAPPLSSSIF